MSCKQEKKNKIGNTWSPVLNHQDEAGKQIIEKDVEYGKSSGSIKTREYGGSRVGAR